MRIQPNVIATLVIQTSVVCTLYNTVKVQPAGRRLPSRLAACLRALTNGIAFAFEATCDFSDLPGVHIMGKYLLAWLFGVPVFVLVILYFIF